MTEKRKLKISWKWKEIKHLTFYLTFLFPAPNMKTIERG
jgi:hypothetical protein